MKKEHKFFITAVFLLSLIISAGEGWSGAANQEGKNSSLSGSIIGSAQSQGDGFAVSDAAEEAVVKETEENAAPLPKQEKKEVKTDLENKEQKTERGFYGLNLTAKGVYVYNLTENKEIFAKNAGARFALASLTKLMTAVVASDRLARDAVVEISETALNEEGDSGFFAGERWRAEDLINIMLVSSSNDAARAIAEKIEADIYKKTGERKKMEDIMNEKALELKMRQTIFFNPAGLDISRSSPGSFGSPKDIFILTKHILEKNSEILRETKNKSFFTASADGALREFSNTNLLLDKNYNIIYGKTGYTDLAGGNLMLVLRTAKGDYVVVALKSGLYDRFSDAEKIIAEIKKL